MITNPKVGDLVRALTPLGKPGANWDKWGPVVGRVYEVDKVTGEKVCSLTIKGVKSCFDPLSFDPAGEPRPGDRVQVTSHGISPTLFGSVFKVSEEKSASHFSECVRVIRDPQNSHLQHIHRSYIKLVPHDILLTEGRTVEAETPKPTPKEEPMNMSTTRNEIQDLTARVVSLEQKSGTSPVINGTLRTVADVYKPGTYAKVVMACGATLPVGHVSEVVKVEPFMGLGNPAGDQIAIRDTNGRVTLLTPGYLAPVDGPTPTPSAPKKPSRVFKIGKAPFAFSWALVRWVARVVRVQLDTGKPISLMSMGLGALGCAYVLHGTCVPKHLDHAKAAPTVVAPVVAPVKTASRWL